jgi:hypothetical protein
MVAPTYPPVKEVAEAGIQVFIVSRRRWQPGDYEGWAQTFARGTSMGRLHG